MDEADAASTSTEVRRCPGWYRHITLPCSPTRSWPPSQPRPPKGGRRYDPTPRGAARELQREAPSAGRPAAVVQPHSEVHDQVRQCFADGGAVQDVPGTRAGTMSDARFTMSTGSGGWRIRLKPINHRPDVGSTCDSNQRPPLLTKRALP